MGLAGQVDAESRRAEHGLSLPWLQAAAVVSVAIIIRLVFFTGVFGSDDVTYTQSALRILQGDWSVSSYIGATRYGVNLPVALFMNLVGQSQLGAGLWSMIASIAEILLVFHFAGRLWGRRAAVFCGLLLAFLPLHVHFAGRMMADAPLALFVTLSFVLFWHAERTGKRALYVACGLAIGAVFWIKELVLIFSLAFVAVPIIWQRFDRKWLIVVAASILPVLVNFLLFKMLTGDFFYLLDVIAQASENISANLGKNRDIMFYPKYLLFDLRHTWLLGLLSLGAAVLAFRTRNTAANQERQEHREQFLFPWIWFLGLLVILTFFPASLSPLELIFKQTNYMMIFIAPLCLLAGWFLTRLDQRVAAAIMAIYVAGGILLSGAEQQAIRSFVANSKATATFAQENRDAILYVGSNAEMVAFFRNMTGSGTPLAPDQLRSIAEAPRILAPPPEDGTYRRHLAILDYETADWGVGAALVPGETIACWRHLATLQPEGFGMGQSIMNAIAVGAGLLPGSVAARAQKFAESYVSPKPAEIYEIMPACRDSQP